jgi:hypothetical protein
MKKSLIAIAILSTFTVGMANASEATTNDDLEAAAQRHIQRMEMAQNEADSWTRPQEFQWIGGSIGMANKTFTNPATAGFGVGQAAPVGIAFAYPTNSMVQPNFTLNYTNGIVFSQTLDSKHKKTTYGGAFEANLLAMNSRLIPLFKIDGVVVLPGESLIFMPNIGYSVRTGSVFGLDALHPICNQNDCSISLKVGITKFNKAVEGANFVANVGIVKAF